MAETYSKVKATVAETYRKVKATVAETYSKVKATVAETYSKVKATVAETYSGSSYWSTCTSYKCCNFEPCALWKINDLALNRTLFSVNVHTTGQADIQRQKLNLLHAPVGLARACYPMNTSMSVSISTH